MRFRALHTCLILALSVALSARASVVISNGTYGSTLSVSGVTNSYFSLTDTTSVIVSGYLNYWATDWYSVLNGNRPLLLNQTTAAVTVQSTFTASTNPTPVSGAAGQTVIIRRTGATPPVGIGLSPSSGPSAFQTSWAFMAEGQTELTLPLSVITQKALLRIQVSGQPVIELPIVPVPAGQATPDMSIIAPSLLDEHATGARMTVVVHDAVPVDSDTLLTLTSSAPDRLVLPPTMLLVKGESFASVPLQPVADRAGHPAQDITLTATHPDGKTATSVVRVTDRDVHHLEVDPVGEVAEGRSFRVNFSVRDGTGSVMNANLGGWSVRLLSQGRLIRDELIYQGYGTGFADVTLLDAAATSRLEITADGGLSVQTNDFAVLRPETQPFTVGDPPASVRINEFAPATASTNAAFNDGVALWLAGSEVVQAIGTTSDGDTVHPFDTARDSEVTTEWSLGSGLENSWITSLALLVKTPPPAMERVTIQLNDVEDGAWSRTVVFSAPVTITKAGWQEFKFTRPYLQRTESGVVRFIVSNPARAATSGTVAARLDPGLGLVPLMKVARRPLLETRLQGYHQAVAGVWSGAWSAVEPGKDLQLLATDGPHWRHGFSTGKTTVTQIGALKLAMSGVLKEGAPDATLTVSVSKAATFDQVIQLTGADAEMELPATVTLPARKTSVSVPVHVVNDDLVEDAAPKQITAELAGYVPTMLDVTVEDDADSIRLELEMPASTQEGQAGWSKAIVRTDGYPKDSPLDLVLSVDDGRRVTTRSAQLVPRRFGATVDFRVESDGYPTADRTATFTISGKRVKPISATCLVTDADKRLPIVSLGHGYQQGRDTVYEAVIGLLQGTPSDFTATFESNDPLRLEVPASKRLSIAGATQTMRVVVHDLPGVTGASEASFTMRIPGLPDIVTQVPVPDRDAHHLEVSGPQASQPRGQSFFLRAKAKTVDDADADFSALPLISAHDASGVPVRVEPEDTVPRFNGGQWSGTMKMRDLGRGVVLVVRTKDGVIGESAPFDVVDGPLHHFDLSGVPASATVNTAFPLTITARDDQGNLITSYTGTPLLSALVKGTTKQVSVGGESWRSEVDPYLPKSDVVNASGIVQRRTQAWYRSLEVGQAKSLREMRLPLWPSDGYPLILRHCTLRLQRASEDPPTGFLTSGWTTVFSGDIAQGVGGELVFPFSAPFEHDGTSPLVVDLSFDNATAAAQARRAGGLWLEPSVCLSRVVTTPNGDPLTWNHTKLDASVTTSGSRPDFIFSGTMNVPMSPTMTTAFVNGQWSGDVRLLKAAQGVTLRVDDRITHDSTPFDVSAAAHLGISVSGAAMEGGAPVTVTVTRDGDTRAALAVQVSDGGLGMLDGVPVSLTIPAGSASASVQVQALDNGAPEELRVAPVTASAAGHEPATVAVQVRDDGTSTLTFTLPATVNESARAVTGHLRLGRARSVPTTVTFSSADAVYGQPYYVTPPSSVMLPPGLLDMDVIIGVNDDLAITANRTVRITASCAELSTVTRTLTIIEDDVLALGFPVPPSVMREGRVITLTLSCGSLPPSPLAVTLTSGDPSVVRIGDGTPSGAAAWTGSIPMNTTTTQFAVQAVNDSLRNGRRSCVLTLSSPGMASATMTVTVTDDEPDHLAFGPVPATLTQNATASALLMLASMDGDDVGSVINAAYISMEVDGRWVRDVFWPTNGGTLPTDVPGTVTLRARKGGYGGHGFASADPYRGTSVSYVVTRTTPALARYEFGTVASPQKTQTDVRVPLRALDGTGTQLTTDPGTTQVGLVQGAFDVTSGTPSGTTDAPFHLSEKAGRMQFRVPYAVVSGNGAAHWITSMALKVATASSTPVEHLVVRMAEANTYQGAVLATDTWQSMDLWTPVFSGRHTFDSTGWHTLDLQRAFVIHGDKDLLVDISYANAAAGTPVVLDAVAGSGRQRSTDAEELQVPTIWPGPTLDMAGTTATLVPLLRLTGYDGMSGSLVSGYPKSDGALDSVTLPGGMREFVFQPVAGGTARLLATAWNAAPIAVSNAFQVETLPVTPLLPPFTLTLRDPLTVEDGSVPDAGRVTLTQSVAVPVTVLLTCPDSRVVLPAAVIIPAGQVSASFAMRVLDGHRVETLGPDRATVLATATATGYANRLVDKQISLGSNAQPRLVLRFPTTLKAGEYLSGTAFIFEPVGAGTGAPSALTVNVTSSNPLVQPTLHSFLMDAYTSYYYPDFSVFVDPGHGTQEATITASVDGWISGTAKITCYDAESPQLTLTSSEGWYWPELMEGGVFHLTVSRPTAGPALSVRLMCSDPARVPLPSSVTIRAGKTEATVAVRVANDSSPSAGHPFTIKAFASGFAPVVLPMLIQDPDFAHYTVEANEWKPAAGRTSITLRALNGADYTMLGFSKTLTLSARDESGRSLTLSSPTQVRLTDGYGVFEVALPQAAKGVRLTARDAEGRSVSVLLGDFDAGPATALRVAPIRGPARAGVPFTISVSAVDEVGYIAESFTGKMTLRSLAVTNDTTTLIPVSPQDIGPFVNGRWSGPVVFEQATANAQVAVSLGQVTSTSNTFRVDWKGQLSVALPAKISTGGNAVPMGRVRLDRTTDVPLIVSLKSDAATVLSVPAQVTIPVGEREATFPLTIAHSVRDAGPLRMVVRAGAKYYLDASSSCELVHEGPVAGFVVEAPASARAGVPFPITVRAVDAGGSVVTGFNGVTPLRLISSSGLTERRIVGPAINADPWPKENLVASQFIYLRDELGGPMMIRQIAIEFASPIRYDQGTFNVALKHTLQEAFPAGSLGLDEDGWTYDNAFYDPAKDVSEGRLVLHLRRPFAYDGVSHLMVSLSELNSLPALKSTRLGLLPRAQHRLPNMRRVGRVFPTPVANIVTSSVMPVLSFADELPATLSTSVTGRFERGVWTGLVSIDQALPGARIIAGDWVDGQSRPFDVQPTVPVILSADTQAPDTPAAMSVRWAPVIGAAAYRVEVSPDAGFGSGVTSSPWLNATGYTFPAMPSNQLYHYRVRQRTDIAARDGFWQQTTMRDFAPNRGSGLSIMQSPDAVELARETQVMTETFDAGFAQLPQKVYLLSASNRVLYDKAPSAASGLPIRQLSDPVARLVGQGALLSSQDTPFSDGTVEAWFYPQLGGSASLMDSLLLRADVTRSHYMARITTLAGGVQFALLRGDLNFWFPSPQWLCAPVELKTLGANENWHLIFSARGPVLRAELWRVKAAGAVKEAELSAVDYSLSSGQAGVLHEGGETGPTLVDDLTINASRAPGYQGSGSFVTRTLQPVSVQRWGRLQFNATQPTGAAALVDVLDGNGQVLASGVSAGTDLDSLSAVARSTALQLRLRMTSSTGAVTPVLSDWSLSYRVTDAMTLESDWSAIYPRTVAASARVSPVAPPPAVAGMARPRITDAASLRAYAFPTMGAPGSAAAPCTTTLQRDPATQAPYLIVTYDRRGHATAADFVIELSSDLVTWTDAGARAQELEAAPQADGVTERVTVRVLCDGGSCFVRVRATAR